MEPYHMTRICSTLFRSSWRLHGRASISFTRHYLGAEQQWSPHFFDGSKTRIIPLTFPSYLVKKYRSYQKLWQFKDPAHSWSRDTRTYMWNYVGAAKHLNPLG